MTDNIDINLIEFQEKIQNTIDTMKRRLENHINSSNNGFNKIIEESLNKIKEYTNDTIKVRRNPLPDILINDDKRKRSDERIHLRSPHQTVPIPNQSYIPEEIKIYKNPNDSKEIEIIDNNEEVKIYNSIAFDQIKKNSIIHNNNISDMISHTNSSPQALNMGYPNNINSKKIEKSNNYNEVTPININKFGIQNKIILDDQETVYSHRPLNQLHKKGDIDNDLEEDKKFTPWKKARKRQYIEKNSDLPWNPLNAFDSIVPKLKYISLATAIKYISTEIKNSKFKNIRLGLKYLIIKKINTNKEIDDTIKSLSDGLRPNLNGYFSTIAREILTMSKSEITIFFNILKDKYKDRLTAKMDYGLKSLLKKYPTPKELHEYLESTYQILLPEPHKNTYSFYVQLVIWEKVPIKNENLKEFDESLLTNEFYIAIKHLEDNESVRQAIPDDKALSNLIFNMKAIYVFENLEFKRIISEKKAKSKIHKERSERNPPLIDKNSNNIQNPNRSNSKEREESPNNCDGFDEFFNLLY